MDLVLALGISPISDAEVNANIFEKEVNVVGGYLFVAVFKMFGK